MSAACPSCGKKYALQPGLDGRTFPCKRCKVTLEVRGGGFVAHAPPAQQPAAPPAWQPVPAAAAPPPPAYPQRPYPAYPPPPAEFNDLGADDDGPRRRPAGGGNTLMDYVLLRRHITPTLIVVVFWVGTAVLLLTGFLTVLSSVRSEPSGGVDFEAFDPGPGGKKMAAATQTRFSFLTLAAGLGQMIFGPLVLRLWCEFVIVVFRIHETLLDVKDRLGRR